MLENENNEIIAFFNSIKTAVFSMLELFIKLESIITNYLQTFCCNKGND